MTENRMSAQLTPARCAYPECGGGCAECQPSAQHTPGPIALARENGKRITVDGRFGGSAPHLERVLVFIWRKNGFPLLPLDLRVDEAEQLVVSLRAAIAKAGGGG